MLAVTAAWCGFKGFVDSRPCATNPKERFVEMHLFGFVLTSQMAPLSSTFHFLLHASRILPDAIMQVQENTVIKGCTAV